MAPHDKAFGISLRWVPVIVWLGAGVWFLGSWAFVGYQDRHYQSLTNAATQRSDLEKADAALAARVEKDESRQEEDRLKVAALQPALEAIQKTTDQNSAKLDAVIGFPRTAAP